MATQEESTGEETPEAASCGQTCGHGLPGGLCEKACALTEGHEGAHNCGQYHD